jgi:hypothetical protein
MIGMMQAAYHKSIDASKEGQIAFECNVEGLFIGIPIAVAIFERAPAPGVKCNGKLIAVAIVKPVHVIANEKSYAFFVVLGGCRGIDKQRMYVSEHISAAGYVNTGKHISDTHICQRVIVPL